MADKIEINKDTLKTKFKIEKILSFDVRQQRLSLLLRYKNTETMAILMIQDTLLDKTSLGDILNDITSVKTIYINPPYQKLSIKFKEPTTKDAVFAFPVDEWIEENYEISDLKYIIETSEMYEKITLPYFESHLDEREWIENILLNIAEKDQVLLRNDDFVIVANINWDQKDLTKISLLALSTSTSYYSLRQIDDTNVQLLLDIKKAAIDIMTTEFGKTPADVSLFVNYVPTFPHLYVHIELVNSYNYEFMVGKSILLDEIIYNVQSNPNYYKTAPLGLVLMEHLEIYKKLADF